VVEARIAANWASGAFYNATATDEFAGGVANGLALTDQQRAAALEAVDL
jgi:hypothetical protein